MSASCSATRESEREREHRLTEVAFYQLDPTQRGGVFWTAHFCRVYWRETAGRDEDSKRIRTTPTWVQLYKIHKNWHTWFLRTASHLPLQLLLRSPTTQQLWYLKKQFKSERMKCMSVNTMVALTLQSKTLFIFFFLVAYNIMPMKSQ